MEFQWSISLAVLLAHLGRVSGEDYFIDASDGFNVPLDKHAPFTPRHPGRVVFSDPKNAMGALKDGSAEVFASLDYTNEFYENPQHFPVKGTILMQPMVPPPSAVHRHLRGIQLKKLKGDVDAVADHALYLEPKNPTGFGPSGWSYEHKWTKDRNSPNYLTGKVEPKGDPFKDDHDHGLALHKQRVSDEDVEIAESAGGGTVLDTSNAVILSSGTKPLMDANGRVDDAGNSLSSHASADAPESSWWSPRIGHSRSRQSSAVDSAMIVSRRKPVGFTVDGDSRFVPAESLPIARAKPKLNPLASALVALLSQPQLRERYQAAGLSDEEREQIISQAAVKPSFRSEQQAINERAGKMSAQDVEALRQRIKSMAGMSHLNHWSGLTIEGGYAPAVLEPDSQFVVVDGPVVLGYANKEDASQSSDSAATGADGDAGTTPAGGTTA